MAGNTMKKVKYGPEETKQRLLDSGLELFAGSGFKGVTTRQLAAHAGVNQAAIPYHFGGKEGLYLAIAENIVTFMDQALAELKAKAGEGFDPAAASREELARLLAILVRILAGQVASREHMGAQRAFIIREYASPGKGFDIIYKGGVERLHMMMTAIVAAVMGLDPASDDAIIHGHTVVGQIMGFVAGQAVLCRRLGRDGYDQKTGALIMHAVVKMVLRATGLDDAYDFDEQNTEQINGESS